MDLALVERLFEAQRDNRAGALASYIPELAKADAERYALAVATVDGHVHAFGDSSQPFTLQSVSKPFVYGLALEDRGHDGVHSKVGFEPTGEAFNSIIELERQSHLPYNPMINSGAIAISGLIRGVDPTERLRRVIEAHSRYAGRALQVDTPVYLSERTTGHRNRAIAHLLKHFAVLDGSIDEALDLYFQQCSIALDASDLALMAATLANGGVQPKTGVRAIAREHVKHVLSVMFTCGMYDSAGAWAHAVGLPAKSGVSGAVMVVVPGKMGLAAYSPRLDPFGHSVRSVALFHSLAQALDLSLFAI